MTKPVLKERPNLEVGRVFLTVRTSNKKLSPGMVDAPSLEVFKGGLDDHLAGMI